MNVAADSNGRLSGSLYRPADRTQPGHRSINKEASRQTDITFEERRMARKVAGLAEK